MPPSGNDPETVQAVYQYIFTQYMDRIPVNRTEIMWSGPVYAGIFALVLIGFFFILAFWLRPTRRQRPVLLELTSFAGQLTERVGELRRFDWIVWTTVVLWASYFAVKAVVLGVVY